LHNSPTSQDAIEMKICGTLAARLCFAIAVVVAIETAIATDFLRRQPVSIGADAVVQYVRSCRKANGAFGPFDQQYTDAAWNYPAVHTLRLLGVQIPKNEAILDNGLGYPTGHAGCGHWLVYHQAMINWLIAGDSATRVRTSTDEAAKDAVRLVHQGFEVNYYGSPFGSDGNLLFNINGKSTRERFQRATQLGYYNLSSLYYLLGALTSDGRRVAGPEELVHYIHKRQAPNGGFVDIRVAGGRPTDNETHIAHTFHAVATLRLLGSDVPNPDECVRFVKSCQVGVPTNDGPELGVGGFLWNPDASLPGNYPDVYYTWAGLQVLHLLEARPDRLRECVDWVNSLQNHDGGFGDRSGWRSRLYSTYYAVHSLALLTTMGDTCQGARSKPDADQAPGVEDDAGTLDSLMGTSLAWAVERGIMTKRVPSPKIDPIPEGVFEIYQGLHKIPVIEPDDLNGLRRRGFHLLALKSDDLQRAEPLLEAIRKKRLPMDVILCPEAYPHRLRRFGGPLLHHVGNFTLNPSWDAGQRQKWTTADESGRKGLDWDDYQRQVLNPLQQLGSLCYPEQDFEMEYAYSAYDDGVYGRNGYNAVQAGFNWSPRDFVRVFPWRERYVDKLPAVADADAHGDLQKWSPQLDHTRHVYIARGPGYDQFLEASRNGRVVCVIAEPEGVASGFTYYGHAAAVHYVKKHIDEWKW
jgi:hypothetical protein